MQITTDSNGYVSNYALIGDIEGGIVVPDPKNTSDFAENFAAYKLDNGVLTLDTVKLAADVDAATLSELRRRRETECLPVINRGFLWYDHLTSAQMDELDMWYQNWLDVTDTQVVPDRPVWIN